VENGRTLNNYNQSVKESQYMNFFKGSTRISIETKKSTIEIDSIINDYVSSSEKVQKWRFLGNRFEINSKERAKFLVPSLPVFMITIEIFEKRGIRGIISKVSGNLLINFFLRIGIFVFILFVSFLIYNAELSSSIYNVIGLLLGLFILYRINSRYRKEGETEYNKIKATLLAPARPTSKKQR
jgi:hypothetical protein